MRAACIAAALLFATSAWAEEPVVPQAPTPSTYSDQGMVREPATEPSSDAMVKTPEPTPYEDKGMLAPADASNALTPGQQPPHSLRVEALQGDFKFDFTGFVRTRFALTEGDARAPFIGRNNGFNIGNARFAITAGYKEKLFVRIQLEGGVDRQNFPNSAVGQLQLALRDAFVAYEPWKFLRITVGQFKAPFDAESMADLNDVMFISRAVYLDGVRGTEGWFAPGLGYDRELGIKISGERLKINDWLMASYFLAVTNGNADNASVNDNNAFALWARGELYLPYVRVGVATQYNPTTSGVFPALFDEQRLGVATDVRFELKGFWAFAQFIYTQTAFPTTKAPKVVGMGAHAQVGYKFWFGLTPSYRIAWFEPNDRIAIDQLLYHTIGLSYDLPWVPVRVMANGTLTGEQAARSLHNNQIDFLVQATFP